jgi:hypothetical protein
MGFLAGALRKNHDASNNKSQQNARGCIPAQRQTASVTRLIKKVTYDRS